MTAKQLLTALRAVSCAVRTTTTIPVLRGVKINVDGATTTDLACFASHPLPYTGPEVVVDHAELVRFLATVDARAEILSQREDGHWLVQVDGVEARFPTLAGDFPDTPTFEPGMRVEVESVEDIAGVLVAASRDEARPVLTGLCLRAEHTADELPRALTLSATDSYRIYVAVVGELPAGPEESVLLPHSYLARLPKAGTTSFTFAGYVAGFPWARVTRGAVTLTLRAIDRKFPDHRLMTPGERAGTIDLGADGAKNLAKIAKVAGTRSNAPLRISINGTVDLAIGDDTRGTSYRMSDVGSVTPPRLVGEFGYNPGFLLESVKFAGPRLDVISPLRPVVMRDGNRTALCMPIRLNV